MDTNIEMLRQQYTQEVNAVSAELHQLQRRIDYLNERWHVLNGKIGALGDLEHMHQQTKEQDQNGERE